MYWYEEFEYEYGSELNTLGAVNCPIHQKRTFHMYSSQPNQGWAIQVNYDFPNAVQFQFPVLPFLVVLELVEPAPLFPVFVAPAVATDLLALELAVGLLAEAEVEVTALDVELFALRVDVVVEADDEPVEPVEPEVGLPFAVTVK